MADDPKRSVALRRTGDQRYVATNVRGGEITFGNGSDESFTPVELLLAAIAGCSAIDVDILTTRRAEPDSFEATATANKLRNDDGNHLEDIDVTFRVRFPSGEAGDKAREILPDAVQRSHDRLCTVSRTVELGTPVALHAEE